MISYKWNEDNLKKDEGTKYVLYYSIKDDKLYSYLNEVNKDVYLYYNNEITTSYLNIINEQNEETKISINNKEDLINNL